MTVALTDDEAEQIAQSLEGMSEAISAEYGGKRVTGMGEAENWAKTLRERSGVEMNRLVDCFRFAYRMGERYERTDGAVVNKPEVVLGATPADATRSDLIAAGREMFRREGYDPDAADFMEQLKRRVGTRVDNRDEQ